MLITSSFIPSQSNDNPISDKTGPTSAFESTQQTTSTRKYFQWACDSLNQAEVFHLTWKSNKNCIIIGNSSLLLRAAYARQIILFVRELFKCLYVDRFDLFSPLRDTWKYLVNIAAELLY